MNQDAENYSDGKGKTHTNKVAFYNYFILFYFEVQNKNTRHTYEL